MVINDEEFFNNLQKLMRIKTVRCDCGEESTVEPLGKGINEAIELMLSIGKSFGFKTKNLDGYCGWIEIGEGGKLLGILTHLDVVSAEGNWKFEPFDLTVSDGRAYGRGILDDKGAAMLSLYAMKRIMDSGVLTKNRVRLILGGDEERGEWRCIERYKKTEEIPDMAFTPDGVFPVVFAEKGLLKIQINAAVETSDLTFEFKGGKVINMVPDYAQCTLNDKKYVKRGIPAHASEPRKGINAIVCLAKELISKDSENPFLKLLCSINEVDLGIALSDEPSGKLTINPSITYFQNKGGYLICDIRYPVTKKLSDFYQNIEKAVEKLGFEVEIMNHEKPLYISTDSPLVKTLKDVYEKYTGDSTPPVSMGGGTYAKAFENTVAFGLIFPNSKSGCHEVNEFMELEDMDKAYNLIYAAVKELIHIL